MRYKNLALATTLIVALGLQGCGGGGTDKSSGEKESSLTSYKAPNEVSETDTSSESKVTEVTSSQSQSSASDTQGSNDSHVYILKKKSITYSDHNETTVYELNASSLAYSTMTSTTGDVVKKKYDYNTTSNTLNVFVKNIINDWELTQVATFADGITKDVVDFTHGKDSYMINTFDLISFFDKRVVKNIKDIEMGLFNVQTYEYDENGSVNSITAGYLDELNATKIMDEQEVLATDVVHTEVEPNFSDDGKTVTKDNVVYEFVKFDSGNKE